MKKILSLLAMLLVLALCLVSCGGDGKKTTPAESTPATTPAPTTPPPLDPSEYLDSYLGFAYLKEDLSSYGSIPASAYAALSLVMDATDKDVDEYIAELLSENPIEILVNDRPVKDGDVIYLYYEGSIDGEPFEGGSNMEDDEPYPLEIGSGSFIPGFEEALIGLIPSETETSETFIDVTFPDDYHVTLAGKAAKFEVYIVSIVDGYEERTALTPEFLTELGYETEESDVIAAFRADVLAEMRKEIAADYDTLLRERLLELVFESFSLTRLPEAELTRQTALIVEEVETYFSYYGSYYGVESLDEFAVLWLGLEQGADWRAEATRLATEKLSRTLFLYTVAQNEGITVSEERFAELLEELSDEYGMKASEIIRLAGADIVYDEAIYLAVTDLLLSRATVDNGELPPEGD